MERRKYAALAFALLLGGCAGGDDRPDAGSQVTRIEMQARFADCTRQYGYAPDQSEALGPHELAPQEREWRGCAYRAVEEVVVPRARAPENFRSLIAADRRLTEEVASGKTTREQRRAQIQALLDRAVAREGELERTAQMSQQWPALPPYAGAGGAASALSVHNANIASIRAGLR